MNKLDKFLFKHSYYVISILFSIGLILVVFIKNNIEDKDIKLIIDYYFWLSSGLLLGFAFASYLFKKHYNKIFPRKDK